MLLCIAHRLPSFRTEPRILSQPALMKRASPVSISVAKYTVQDLAFSRLTPVPGAAGHSELLPRLDCSKSLVGFANARAAAFAFRRACGFDILTPRLWRSLSRGRFKLMRFPKPMLRSANLARWGLSHGTVLSQFWHRFKPWLFLTAAAAPLPCPLSQLPRAEARAAAPSPQHTSRAVGARCAKGLINSFRSAICYPPVTRQPS